MRNRNIMGLLLLVIGIVLILQAFDLIGDFRFDGWWTLFLIIPAVISMSRTGFTVGNGILLVLGVGFLLKEQGWDFTKYVVPAIFIVLGVGILFKK
ncbi:hypothetical protein RJI07_01875 [Mycoplasmatota bacterium WC30]